MNLLQTLHKRYSKNLAVYLAIGLVWTLFNIFLIWLFIDILGASVVIGSTIAVIIIFIAKYYSYLVFKLIHNRPVEYIVISIMISAANVFLMWLFADIMHIGTVFSATISTYLLIIAKFFIFDLFKILKHED